MALDRKSVMLRADQMVAQGQLEPAIGEYRRLLRAFPEDMVLMNRFGDLCVQAGKLGEAAPVFKVLALNLQRDHQEKKAIALLRRLLRFSPDDPEAAHQLVELLHATGSAREAAAVHFQLAEWHRGRGEEERALAEFSQGVAADPANLEQRVALARRYQQAGQQEKASGQFLDAAESFALAGRFEEARALVGEAGPEAAGARYLLTLARIEVLAGRPDLAIVHLLKALGAHPANPLILESLAEAEIQAGRPAEGLVHLGSLRHPEARIMPLLEHAMTDLIRAGNARQALRLIRPIARRLASRGHSGGMAAALKSAFAEHSALPIYWIAQAEVALESDHRDRAIKALRQAYVQAGKRGSKLLARLLHRRLEELEGKQTTSSQIVVDRARQSTMGIPVINWKRLDPQAKLQLERMEREAVSQARLGNLQGAQAMLQDIISQEPARFSSIRVLVDLLVESGQLPKAHKQCIESARALNLFGHKQEAIQLLDIAEKHFPGSSLGPRRMMGL